MTRGSLAHWARMGFAMGCDGRKRKVGQPPNVRAVRRMVLGIDERIDGVNLGNWLVLEKWMDPKPFTRSAEDDEIWMHRTHVSLWSERNLAEELRRHRETYITLEDFRIIADHGINLVRIPIPYFIFGDWPGHPAASRTSTARSVGRGRRD